MAQFNLVAVDSHYFNHGTHSCYAHLPRAHVAWDYDRHDYLNLGRPALTSQSTRPKPDNNSMVWAKAAFFTLDEQCKLGGPLIRPKTAGWRRSGSRPA